MRNTRSKVESEVLKLYKKVNPSQMEAIYDAKFFMKFFRETSENWINHLKITPSFFTNKCILDVGCGTGEYDICYGLWGAKVQGIDINNYAIKYAQRLVHKFSLTDRVTFKRCSLFNAKFKPSSFDIVICDGVLHHTADPQIGFKKMAKYVKEGGFLVIGIGEEASFFQKSLQRLIVRLLSDGKKEKMAEWAQRLFPENIERAVRFGNRSRKQIIYDVYIVPQQEGLTCPDILALAEYCGLVYYSSWPPIELPLQVNPCNRHPALNIKSTTTQLWLRILQLRWMLASREDDEYLPRFLRNAPQIISTFDTFMKVFKGITSIVPMKSKSTKEIVDSLQKSTDDLAFFVRKLFKLIKDSEKQIIVSLQKDVRSLTTIIKSLKIIMADYPHHPDKRGKIIKKVLKGLTLFRGLNGVPTNYFTFYKHSKNTKKLIAKHKIKI